MDLPTVEAIRTPTSRADIWPLDGGAAVLAGGTWLFSEPQLNIRELVDITALGWNPVLVNNNSADTWGLEISATCTVEELAGISTCQPEFAAAPLFAQCARALKASFKVSKTATVGGNICLSFPAGSVISLCSALDAHVLIWRPDGTDYLSPINDFVTGRATNLLRPSELLRSIHLPAASLRARTAFRKIAPAPLGRSGVVVIGRRDTDEDGGQFVVSITGATVRPYVFRFDTVPTENEQREAHAAIPLSAWTDDAHGDPDWRQAMALLLTRQVVADLS